MRHLRLSETQGINFWGSFILSSWLFLLLVVGQNFYVDTVALQARQDALERTETTQVYTGANQCKLDQINWSTLSIIHTIAILETQGGKTGVGASLNNLTGLRDSEGYLHFSDPNESIWYSANLWDKNYRGMSVCSALAKWKTGNPKNIDTATLNYINNFEYLNRQAFNILN